MMAAQHRIECRGCHWLKNPVTGTEDISNEYLHHWFFSPRRIILLRSVPTGGLPCVKDNCTTPRWTSDRTSQFTAHAAERDRGWIFIPLPIVLIKKKQNETKCCNSRGQEVVSGQLQSCVHFSEGGYWPDVWGALLADTPGFVFWPRLSLCGFSRIT